MPKANKYRYKKKLLFHISLRSSMAMVEASPAVTFLR
jgi:hypothetical protein